MLDVGLSELLLIVVVALVVIGPKDLPVVIRHVMKFVREIRGLLHGLKQQMNEVLDEAGVNDLRDNMTTIIDLDGKPQKAYNIDDLKHLGQKKPVITDVPTDPKPPEDT